MKLFEKTRKNHIIYSVIYFYNFRFYSLFYLKKIVGEKQDEKLLWDKELIARKIKYEYPLPIFEVEDFKSKTPIKDTLYLKDTLMYQVVNNVENYELYRQLTSVETLQGKTYRLLQGVLW